MLTAFVGNRFLIDEAARAFLRESGLDPRDVPWLDEDLSVDAVQANLQAGLFGPAALVADIGGLRRGAPDPEEEGGEGGTRSVGKDYKPIAEALAADQAAVAVLLDPEDWGATEPARDRTRKQKSQESRAKAYGKLGEVRLLPTPQKGALVAWVVQRAKAMRVRLERAGAELLAETFPGDPATIASELEKLALLDGPLDAATVARVVNHLPPSDAFAVLDAVTAGQGAQAVERLQRLLDSGEEPFKLMGALVTNYLQVARVRALLTDEGPQPVDVIASRLGMHRFPAEKALAVARRLDEAQVRASLATILEADTGMRSGSDPRLVLEGLLVTLAGRPGGSRRAA